MEHQLAMQWKSLALLAVILSALFVTVGFESAPAVATEKVSSQKLPDHDPHASLRPEDKWHGIGFDMTSFHEKFYSCSGYPFADATEGSCEGYSDQGWDPFPKNQQMMFRWDPYGQNAAHPRRLKITIRANNDYIYGVIDGPNDRSMSYASDGSPVSLPDSHFTSSSGKEMILRNPLEWAHEPMGAEGGPLDIRIQPERNPVNDTYELSLAGQLYW